MFNYDTVTAALAGLKERGYSVDFNLKENLLCCTESKRNYTVSEIRVQETYRFEGDTDPADEAVVHALIAVDGVKGTFVNGYGIYADTDSDALLPTIPITP